MLTWLALPVPAMSKAVPWSTEVRSIGRPSETLTAVSNATSLIGMWPWSWYCATTRSKAPLIGAMVDGVGRDRADDVDALGAGRGDGGGELLVVLGAEEAVLAAVRVDAGDGDPRRGDPHALQVRVAGADRREHALGRGPARSRCAARRGSRRG